MSVENFFIGREEEKQRMQSCIQSKDSRLVAVLGRRRVGKTYFIKNTLLDVPHFYFTGIQDVSRERLLLEFSIKINEMSGYAVPVKEPKDWFEAFALLKQLLIEKFGKSKKVVFLDEFPWMDTHASGFMPAFEYFWNDWAVNQNILVIICGSATSWMMNNILRNKSGLHNRVSEYFRIKPFNLLETEQYFAKKSISLSRYDIVQIYMAMGGIPHYLSLVRKGESVPVCIDRLFFEKDAPLKSEYANLYRALFTHYENYELIVEKLAQKRKGLTRQEIIESTKFTNGGGLTKILNELEECGFIQFQLPFSNKKREGLYRLVDEYSFFYHHFVTRNSSKGQFISIYNTPKVRSWMGISFETLCMKHIDNIKYALGISGVYTKINSYYLPARTGSPGFQIDLIIDRADNIINICEMKFYGDVITFSQKDEDAIRERRVKFQSHTNTKKNVMVLFISPFGVKYNKYSLSVIDQSVSIDALF